ncbi:MAG: TolC family outer membrane protein [Acidiferrobacterales bacterium]|nr:TolC family outer membrane protein [Acidiferrobacterales bacterium]
MLPAAAYAENVVDVYRLALQNDSRFRAAQATYRADLQRLPQARGALLPTISGQGSAVRNDLEVRSDLNNVPTGKANFGSTEFSLSLTQPLYNSALFAGLRQARAEVRRAEAQFAAARQDLIVRVAESYIAVLAALDNVDLNAAQKAANGRQLEVVEGRLEVGLATVTDVHQARARYELDVAGEIEALNILRDTRQGLREITGKLIDNVARLKQDAPLIEPDPPDVEKWVQTTVTQNPTIVAARETAQISLEEIKRQRAGHLPTLDFVGNARTIDDEGSASGPGVETDRTEYGLQLNVPIYQGGRVSAATREAGYRYGASQQDLETLRRSTERTTRSAFLGVVSGASRIRALRQSVIAAESAVEAKREGFEAGINTNLEVLDAQRDLFISATDLLRARYDYILNILRLKQAAGLLSEEDLARFSKWLQ